MPQPFTCCVEIWPTRFLPSDIRPGPVAAFADLLTKVEVRLVIDVRTVSWSSTNPQYNSDVLPESLSAYQIAYEHMAVLGGLRGRKRDVLPAVNAFWENQSFHNYADYAMSEDFHSGLIKLRAAEMAAPVLAGGSTL